MDATRTEHGADPVQLRRATDADRVAIEQLLLSTWRTTRMISRDVEHDLTALPAIIASSGVETVGLTTLAIDREEAEMVTLNALTPRRGIGTMLLDAAAQLARDSGCRRLWLITTNDNLDALRFYQRRGLRLVAVYPGAVDRARKLKPKIPRRGHYGIALRDELELELPLG